MPSGPALRLALLLLLCSGCAVSAQRLAPPKKAPAKTNATTVTETKSIETLTESARKSIVVIKHFGRDGKENGVGAGFIISADGLIATSLHVIGEARPISVELADGKNYEVTEVHAWDRNFDLAIIRVAAEKLHALPLGDSDSLKQGAPVIALGNPLGLQHSVVQGLISARREVDGVEMLQIAIPIEPGNSGGPLLDLKGRVQGVLTLKSAMTANLGFAMPANLVKTLLEKPNPVPMNRWLTIAALNSREWKTVFGAKWSQKAGRILVEGAGSGFGGRSLCLSQRAVPEKPYEIAVDVRLDDEAGAAGLAFSSDGGDRHYGFYPSAGQLRLTRFDGPSVYSWNILRQFATEHYQPGEWNHLRVRVEPEKISCYVNGQLVTESTDDALESGFVGLAKFRETKAEFRNFRIGTNLTTATKDLSEQLLRQLRESSDLTGSTIADELRSQPSIAQSALRERARELEREAKAMRTLAASLHRESVQAELVKALEGPESKIDLFHAALLIARLDNPDLDVEPYREQVKDMAREISANLPASTDDLPRLAALKQYLFAENGFHGSRSDYYNQANSYLNAVLDDREGLPITLSILFMQLAEGIGLRGVTGLPLPGHFMVRFASKDGADQIIDTFNGGKSLTRSEAQDRVFEASGVGFRDTEFRAATKHEIILRMLRNLLSVAERKASATDMLRYLDVILAIAPDGISDRLNRARLRLQSGDAAAAKVDFKWLLDEQPPGLDLDRIAELYRSL